MSIPGMPPVTITSLGQYVWYLEEHCRVSDTLLFRGQCEDGPLLPKVARLKPREKLL